MFRNKGFFERTEIGDRGVSGSIRIECLCNDWGKVGFRGDETIYGIGDEFTIDSSFFWCLGVGVKCVLFVVEDVAGECEPVGMNALAAHFVGVCVMLLTSALCLGFAVR